MKEGKVFKRILAVALVIVMTVTMVPFGVFAADVACQHQWELEAIPRKEATCTEDGNIAYYECRSQCGAYKDSEDNIITLDQTVIPAGHKFGNWVAGIDSTCTVAGTKGYFLCSECGKKFKADKKTEITDITQELAEHTWDAGVETKAATCKEDGVKTFTCTAEGCGATKTEPIAKLTTHTYGTDGKCSVCGVECNHTGGVADCENAAVCDICGASYGSVRQHEMETSVVAPTCYSKGYTLHDCKFCDYAYTDTETEMIAHTLDNGTITTAPTCTAKGVKTIKCTVEGCTYEKTEEVDKAPHAAVAIPEVEAACGVAGSKGGQKCSVCGEILVDPVESPALEHDLETFAGVAATCTVAGTTKGERCKREGCTYVKAQETIPALGHEWSAEKVVVTDSTCTAKGTKAIACTREGCDAVKEGTAEDIEMKPHTWEATKTVTKTETCEADGEKAILCSVCDAKKTDSIEVIGKLGHDWDEGTVKVAADCQKDGVTTFKCKREGCGKTEDRKVDKLDHDYKEVITEPTCETDGYSTFTCSMCKSSYVDKKVSKFNHSFITYVQDEGSATCYSDGTKTAECDHGCGKTNTVPDENSKIDHVLTDFEVVKPATCTEEGEDEAKCFYYEKCGYSEAVDTEALGHTITADTEYTVDVPATCTTKGSQSKHCERCDYTEGSVEIPELGHDYQPGAGTDATCTTGGHIKYVCTRCADSYDVDNAPALGHDFQYVSNNNATCKEDGTETGKCSRCDVVDTRTEAGSKLPHTLGEAVITPATTKADGLSVKTCTVCGEDAEVQEIAKVASLSLKYTVAVYNGNQRIPKLTITDANGNALVKGTDYTVVTPTKEESAEIGTHSYTVTFMGNYEGEEEVTYKVIPTKTSKIISSKTKQGSVALKWASVKGADGYRVYVYNSSTGKYKTLATVKGKTTYTATGLKAGTKYKFAVKAYAKADGEVYWADTYTTAIFTTLVTKTSKIAATTSKTAIKLTWKAVSGADGYRVYVYNSKTGKYKTVATVKGKTTYTIKGLKAGTTYKYAVKAYDLVDGKGVWSNQYTTLKVTTKK